MPTESVTGAVLSQVEQAAPGAVLFPTDLLHLGNQSAIHTTLFRLVEAGKLIRLGQGIYLKPKVDPELGIIKPSLEQLAYQIADRDKVIIRPTGVYALNKLGLSTQVPVKAVFLTNGNPKKINIGKSTIVFKRISPKQLAVKSEKVFLAIQALNELKHRTDIQSIVDHLRGVLSSIPPEDIHAGARLAPQRIGRILHNIADQIEKRA